MLFIRRGYNMRMLSKYHIIDPDGISPCGDFHTEQLEPGQDYPYYRVVAPENVIPEDGSVEEGTLCAECLAEFKRRVENGKRNLADDMSRADGLGAGDNGSVGTR